MALPKLPEIMAAMVYRVMEEIGISHRPKRKANGITKADREARKSDDLLKRDFSADESLKKCVTDITEIKARDGKLYVSTIFDCFDSVVLGLAMDTSMKAELCQQMLANAATAYPGLRGVIVHSDRGRSVWRYFLGYWNNRRICSANDGLPPLIKRQCFYGSLPAAS